LVATQKCISFRVNEFCKSYLVAYCTVNVTVSMGGPKFATLNTYSRIFSKKLWPGAVSDFWGFPNQQDGVRNSRFPGEKFQDSDKADM
jgi:hypothetical protein